MTRGDVLTVGRVLGHESPQTTMVYVDYFDDGVAEHVARIYKIA